MIASVESMLDAIEHFITTFISSYGYLAIFVLMALESACIPIPSEVTMLFAGALCTAPFLAVGQHLDLPTVIVIGTFGNLVGSWVAWGVGYKGGRSLVDRFGRALLLRPHEIDRAHDWFEHKGAKTVFIARLLPVIRTFISLPAGVARMGFWRFTIYTVLGCLPFVAALAILGAVVGRQWEEVKKVLEPFSWLILAICVGVIVWWVRKRLAERRAESTG